MHRASGMRGHASDGAGFSDLHRVGGTRRGPITGQGRRRNATAGSVLRGSLSKSQPFRPSLPSHTPMRYLRLSSEAFACDFSRLPDRGSRRWRVHLRAPRELRGDERDGPSDERDSRYQRRGEQTLYEVRKRNRVRRLDKGKYCEEHEREQGDERDRREQDQRLAYLLEKFPFTHPVSYRKTPLKTSARPEAFRGDLERKEARDEEHRELDWEAREEQDEDRGTRDPTSELQDHLAGLHHEPDVRLEAVHDRRVHERGRDDEGAGKGPVCGGEGGEGRCDAHGRGERDGDRGSEGDEVPAVAQAVGPESQEDREHAPREREQREEGSELDLLLDEGECDEGNRGPHHAVDSPLGRVRGHRAASQASGPPDEADPLGRPADGGRDEAGDPEEAGPE